jgi:hypothetical protein
MKKLILFSIFVFITISCAPSQEEIQETVQAIIAETQAAVPTVRFILVVSTTTPTNAPPKTTAIPASATSTETTQLELTTTAFPVTGSVDIGPGRSRAGGFEGETIQVRVDFSATSPFGRVSRMRVTWGCRADTEHADWEPFVDSKTYPVTVVLNWTGFYICVQFQDEYGNLSPVYHDDISVEGFPRKPLVNPTDWYPQIQCFSDKDVHPSQGEVVTGTTIIFSWPDKNNLPDGVFYKIFAHALGYNAPFLASGQTSETSITLQIPREHAGEFGWYILLVDANGTYLDHAQCSSFSASLLTVDPPVGIKGIRFWYRP